MNKSKPNCDYEFKVMGCLLVIVDLDRGNMSVTNDIEAVIWELSRDRDLSDYAIIYRDSDYHYDRIRLKINGTFDCFESLQTNDVPTNDMYDAIVALTKIGALEE